MTFLFDNEEDDLTDEPGAFAAETSDAGLLLPRQSALCLGYETAERQLLAAFNEGRMPHAIILAGPEGIGKATFAFRLARFLLKQGAGSADAGPSLFGDALPVAKPENFNVATDDPVFTQVASAGHPDLLTIERIVNEKTGKLQDIVAVDEVRRVTPFLRLTASQSGWRVVIVDDADTMNRNSQNALLKILEEPPPKTMLILVAHRPGALTATIRSRCRLIPIQPPEPAIFGKLLRTAQPELSDTAVNVLYAIGGGSTGQGLRLAREGGLEAVARFMTLLESWPAWDWKEIHVLADGISRPDQEESLRAFETIFLWAIEAMVRAKARGEKLPVPLDGSAAVKILNHYPLVALLEICENLRRHFSMADEANLDKRQAILGAFSIFGSREAA